MMVQWRRIGLSLSRQGGMDKELKTRCETWQPAERDPSDGSKGGHWNYPQASGTRPSHQCRSDCCLAGGVSAGEDADLSLRRARSRLRHTRWDTTW